jgi:polyferredoxin
MSLHALAADVIIASHFAVVLFVVVGQVLILLGGFLDWNWVRIFWLRLCHLVLIIYIAMQAWLGELCPLTVWEQALRQRAGQNTHQDSFIEYWLSRLLYIEAPWWMFVALYTALAVLVVFSWWWVRPIRSGQMQNLDEKSKQQNKVN